MLGVVGVVVCFRSYIGKSSIKWLVVVGGCYVLLLDV